MRDVNFSKKNIPGTHSILIIVMVVFLLAGIIYWGSHLLITLADFSVNWSAGSLILEGENPYNSNQIVAREQTTGLDIENADMMQYWYPPWALAVSMLFGLINYQTSQIMWLLLSIGIICFCAATLWQLYRGGQQSQWFAWLAALTFTPALYALIFGQFNPLVLLGLTGFLIYIRRDTRRADLFSGLFLGLCAIKPALLYLFWPALLLWCLSERRIRVLAGLSLAIIAGTLISMIFRSAILLDYWQFIKIAAVTNWKVPTLGYWLSNLQGLNTSFWRYLPIGLGLIWLLVHWILHRRQWDWPQQISWLTFMSLITTVFAWSHDQILLIPAIIEAAVLIHSQVKSFPIRITLLFTWFALVVFMFISHLTHDDSWFVWQAPVLLLAYILIKRNFSAKLRADNTNFLPG